MHQKKLYPQLLFASNWSLPHHADNIDCTRYSSSTDFGVSLFTTAVGLRVGRKVLTEDDGRGAFTVVPSTAFVGLLILESSK